MKDQYKQALIKSIEQAGSPAKVIEALKQALAAQQQKAIVVHHKGPGVLLDGKTVKFRLGKFFSADGRLAQANAEQALDYFALYAE